MSTGKAIERAVRMRKTTVPSVAKDPENQRISKEEFKRKRAVQKEQAGSDPKSKKKEK